MFSPTLMIACILYLLGVGVVLYIRPMSMFHPGGTWREFGLSESDHHTVFPFWMFALIWAVLSYAIASCFLLIITPLTLPSEGIEIYSEPASFSPIETVSEPVQPGAQPAGYYIINPDRINSSGANYIYYGTEPPSPQEVNSFIRRRR